MINYKVSLQKSAIQKADETGAISRQNVYFPQIVDLRQIDFNSLYDVIYANGNSAFTKGEWSGIVLDLGGSVANRLIAGEKVYLPGLGTFEPTLKTSQSNIKDPSKINSNNFECGAKFVADGYFLSNLSKAEWNRKASAAIEASGSASYTMTFKRQNGSANLKFESSVPGVLSHTTVSSITCLVNGQAKGSATVAEGVLYINGVIANGDTLSDATVKLTIPAATWTESGETYEYPAQTFELTGISQTGASVEPPHLDV